MYSNPKPSDATSWLTRLEGGVEGPSCRITACFEAGLLLLIESCEALSRREQCISQCGHLRLEWINTPEVVKEVLRSDHLVRNAEVPSRADAGSWIENDLECQV